MLSLCNVLLFFSCSHSDSKKRFKIAQNNKNIRSYVYSIYIYSWLTFFLFCIFLHRLLLFVSSAVWCDKKFNVVEAHENEYSCVNAVSFSKIVRASFKPSISCSRRFL